MSVTEGLLLISVKETHVILSSKSRVAITHLAWTSDSRERVGLMLITVKDDDFIYHPYHAIAHLPCTTDSRKGGYIIYRFDKELAPKKVPWYRPAIY